MNTVPSDDPNPILKGTGVAWQSAHRLLGVHPFLHAQAPLWHNDSIRVGGAALNWPHWRDTSITSLDQVLETNILKPFTRLIEEFRLHPTQMWKYLQLQHYMHQNRDIIHWGLQPSPIIAYLKTWGKYKGVMAGLYEVLISHLFSRPVVEKLRLQWQTHLQLTFEEEDWADTVDALDSSKVLALQDTT
ncbi:hypothetical protein NDU88_003863 [Pleurodeles waltl]|uniref:Uncharacterized protein n=1 Tax=Pleurodeles waltl TaxID=8319 RepID=A0AAV7T6J4_PLEWA|nr:hypothetical protein NDU88_003863 [Pleurodeles waltl]